MPALLRDLVSELKLSLLTELLHCQKIVLFDSVPNYN